MDPLFWDALFLSLRVAALASGILLLAGAPLAWLLAFRRFPGKALLEAVFLLPLVLPPTVLGFYLLLFLGPEGPWARLFGVSWAFRFEGLVLASVLFSLPFALTAYREAFLALDPNLLEVARTLGSPATGSSPGWSSPWSGPASSPAPSSPSPTPWGSSGWS